MCRPSSYHRGLVVRRGGWKPTLDYPIAYLCYLSPLDKRSITDSVKILDGSSHLTSAINQVWVAKTSRRYGGPRLLKIKSVTHRAYSLIRDRAEI